MTYLAKQIARLRKVDAMLAEIAANGVASESISTPNGGSRSISYSTPDALNKERERLVREISGAFVGSMTIKYNIFGGAY